MRCAHRMLLELCASRRGSAVKPLSAAGRDIEQWKAWWQSPWHGALSDPNAIQSSDTFWPALVGILCYVFIGNGKEYGLFRRVKGGMWGFTFEGLCRSTARLPWATTSPCLLFGASTARRGEFGVPLCPQPAEAGITRVDAWSWFDPMQIRVVQPILVYRADVVSFRTI